VTTHICQVVFDAHDLKALATFWKDLLGWDITIDRPDEVEIGSDRPGDVPLGFIPTTEPKRTKNRLHLDLTSTSEEHQRETIERVLSLGGAHADIGQGDVGWSVMSDPEGNEFCVLPADHYAEPTPAIAAFCLPSTDRGRQAAFWEAATGWERVRRGLRYRGGTHLNFGGGDPPPKEGKNRLHIDVAPPADGSIDDEAERLIALGATRVDIGQRDVPWTVLADPEGNEFCILTPREPHKE
jgi:predicted enzyme related to lactoylglutathione lyase